MAQEELSDELQMLVNNKEDGYGYRERRHDDWEENYTLYRDEVKTNRLTQRQSVNIPLMKQHIRTLLKDVDDMPVLYFENIDNDKQAEVFKNEYWRWTQETNNMELQDIVDKKQVFIYGRSFDQWQIMDGRVVQTIQDPYDMLVSRYTDPSDLHSSRFLIHNHIFVPIAKLEDNPDYDQDAVNNLKKWYASEMGLIKLKNNKDMYQEKHERLRDMGVQDVDSPILGEAWAELALHFVKRREKGEQYEQIWLYVEADDREILMKKPLEEVIGETSDNFWRDHYPYESWADDLERQDFWSDGVGDMIRQPNKVLNAWFSQLVENRTLRNFGMNYYDSTNKDFQPGTYTPRPWGWYPIPVPTGGKINDVVKKVDIPELSESLDEMQFVIDFVEKATGATSTQQGAEVDRQITLGEVQLALGEAKERIKGMSKFYTPAWRRRGKLFVKLLEAGADKLDAVKIQKKGKSTDNIYEKEIAPKDWMTKSGYRCRVWSQEEKATKDTDALQKLNLVRANIPLNPKLDEVYKRKLLEFADLTPQEINDIMEIEREKMQQGLSPGMGGAELPTASPNPGANGQTGSAIPSNTQYGRNTQTAGA